MSDAQDNDIARTPAPGRRWRVSIGELLALVLIVALICAVVITQQRLHHAESELAKLRVETGYLTASDPGQIAAARVRSDLPLYYRVRVRVPESPKFRVAYSSVWEKGAAAPAWFAAVDLPPGESMVIVRVAEDPRDERWKITTLVQSPQGNKRFATVLPEEHVAVFRGSGDAISLGVGRETTKVSKDQSIRLLDERWLAGEGGLLLYGDKTPDRDQIGIYAELQPDSGPL